MVRYAAAMGFWLAMIVPTLPFLLPSVVQAQTGSTRLVVVLYPDDNDGRPGNLLFDRGLRTLLKSDSADRVEIHSEFLDLSRSTNPDYSRHLATFLQQKYAGRKIDVVIAGLAPALDFALKYRDEIFPSVPIVFGAIDQREVETRALTADVIGVPIVMDLAGTLELALQLHPRTEHVFVISGKSEFDTRWEAEARNIFRAQEENLQFEYLSGLPLSELAQKLSQLPEHSLIYFLHVFQDADGTAMIPAEVLEQLAAKANAPIYGHVDSYIGRGIVGGKVFQWEDSGQNAARLALRILAGEDAARIGIHATSRNAAMFDWHQLQRWRIREVSLPSGSIVRNQVPSLWNIYKWQIVGVVTLCTLQGLTIAGMLIQRSQRTRAERRFRLAVDAAPNGMLMVAQDGRIVLTNPAAQKLFGYTGDQLLGQLIEELVPVHYREMHTQYRERFFTMAQARPMGVGRNLFGRRKDGTEFPVEIALNPLQTEQGLCVLASVIDITERRRAEQYLLENQQELRLLTGRLITTQEDERRRIARDLHDDFGQTLALLAVQIDVCRQQMGTSTDSAAALDELSARTKELSSAIHDLSHQLHPFKLEQLGLVAAVRALCTECSQSHNLEIEFTDEQIPTHLPREMALCLFRIAQEALRNAIKHGEARWIQVELQGTDDAIRLRVMDNGTGFNPDRANLEAGLGLISMRERLRLLQGEMTIDSAPSQGTQVVAWIPWEPTL